MIELSTDPITIRTAFLDGKYGHDIVSHLGNISEASKTFWPFMKGFVLYKSIINFDPLSITVYLPMQIDMDRFVKCVEVPCEVEVIPWDGGGSMHAVTFYNSNAMDLVGRMMSCQDMITLDRSEMEAFVKNLINNVPNLPKCRVKRVLPNAVVPFKTNASDVGYDLVLIKEHKQVNDVVTLYDTGIQIQLDSGFYAEIVPRSSIIKSGYILANNIGIIDNSYTGNLYVALAKISPSAQPITLPFRGVQLIIRKQEYAIVDEVEDLQATNRGAGGFGSTS